MFIFLVVIYSYRSFTMKTNKSRSNIIKYKIVIFLLVLKSLFIFINYFLELMYKNVKLNLSPIFCKNLNYEFKITVCKN